MEVILDAVSGLTGKAWRGEDGDEEDGREGGHQLRFEIGGGRGRQIRFEVGGGGRGRQNRF